MLSRKKDQRTIKEGVVGKYVKKETPPEMPSECLSVQFTFVHIADILTTHFVGTSLCSQ
jgi:hypothetical protein